MAEIDVDKALDLIKKEGSGMLDQITKHFEARIKSALGEDEGLRTIQSAKGAQTGARIGNRIMPGWGTVIGGLLGMAAGDAEAEMELWEKQDREFQSFIQEEYNTLRAEHADRLALGSELAKQRELAELAEAGFTPETTNESMWNSLKQDTYAGKLETLEAQKREIDSAMGEGYNEERKKGIDRMSAHLSQYGEKLEKIYYTVGQHEAMLENHRDAEIIKAQEELLKVYSLFASPDGDEKAYRDLSVAQVSGEVAAMLPRSK
ncbi:hypothetical protein, partial [Ligaoa zhengdingensis]